MPAFGQTAFGQNRIWPILVFNVLAVVPGCSCCSWLLPVVACWCLLVPIGAYWCLLVPIGAYWCLLVPVGACWCLLVPVGCVCVVGVFKIFGPLPRTPPPPDRPSPRPPKISLFFFSLPPEISFFSL